MVTRTKARILESFQTRKLTGNKGNVGCNGMEKDGLVALGDEECGFLQLKYGGMRGSRWMVGSSVNVLVSGIKAEVFLLLFNRRLGPFRDEQISKKNPVRSFITGQEPMNRPVCPGCFLFWLKSCCIKKNSAFNVMSRPFPWLWEIWVRDYMRVRIYPWLLVLLNFCSILEFSDAANLYIPEYPTSSCAPPPLLQRKWVPPLPLSLRGRARLQVGQSEWQVRKDPLCSLCCVWENPLPILQNWFDIIHCFQYPRCQKTFVLSSFSSNMSLLMIILFGRL